MSSTDCTFDANGCLVCPAVAAAPARAAQVITSPDLGWNAGANSMAQLDGDVHVVFALAALPVGVLVGLKHGRAFPTSPELIENGLYLYTIGGQAFVEVRERGAARGAAQAYALNATLEIKREAGRVTYLAAGVLLWASTVLSTGAVLVNACLYSAGDTIP